MFDTERVFVLAWDYAGEKMGVGKAGYMVEKTLGMNAAASYQVWEEEFGERYDNDKLRQLTKEFLQNYYAGNKVPVKKGLYVLLEYLGQALYKMAVASSSPRWEVGKYLKEAEIEIILRELFVGTWLSIPSRTRKYTEGPVSFWAARQRNVWRSRIPETACSLRTGPDADRLWFRIYGSRMKKPKKYSMQSLRIWKR